MLENLGIALRKQKRLIVIFFLTIFLPALTLGVFGVRAIRNERFRLAKQEENEGRGALRFIKSHIQSKFEEVARALDETARDPAFIEKDHASICGLAEKRFSSNPLIGQAVLLYKDEGSLFPLFLIPPDKNTTDFPKASDASLGARIRKAETLEFVDNNFRAAAGLFKELSNLASGRSLQAAMLTGNARNLQKAGNYGEALRAYVRIVSEYSDCLSPTGMPLGILARLQVIECDKQTGNTLGAAKLGLELYRELLKKPSALSKDRFKIYISLAGEALDLLFAGEKEGQAVDEYRKEYASLKNILSERLKEWEAVDLLEKEVVPELARKLAQSGSARPSPFHFTRNIDGKDLLFMAAWIPDLPGEGTAGIFGVALNDDHLLTGVLAEAVGNVQLDNDAEVVLADLAGRPLTQNKNTPTALPLATEYFEDSFPPWKIEIFKTRTKGLEILDLRRNFYFWTILTLIVLLAFGAFLIVRTIGHEMEVLKIKSDFVSSVSHEFKTPLTSIKALMERLVDGKVRDAGKMDQYFSIISRDTDKLTSLVNNLLDFSRIEEGRKEYVFSDTDIARIASEHVEYFQKEQAPGGPQIRLEIKGEIPVLRADADALSRALANLLSNAVKFTPPGKAVRVGLRKDGESVILEVEDEGIGIHPGELGRVFEKFFQGRNVRDQSVKGTGLGLTLVKHIVEAHRGKVLVESRLGLGSKFSVVLPIKS